MNFNLNPTMPGVYYPYSREALEAAEMSSMSPEMRGRYVYTKNVIVPLMIISIFVLIYVYTTFGSMGTIITVAIMAGAAFASGINPFGGPPVVPARATPTVPLQ